MNFNELFRKWGLERIQLNAGFAEIEFAPQEDDQTAAWEMYVELITRITTQPLDRSAGDEESALTSIYSIFSTTRTILKEKGRNAKEFTKICIIVLNQIIRPFTAKWHKKKLAGAFYNADECLTFRAELDLLQQDLIAYSRLLADMAKVEDLTTL